MQTTTKLKKDTNYNLNGLRGNPNELEADDGVEKDEISKMVRNEEKENEMNFQYLGVNMVVEFVTLNYAEMLKIS